MASEDQMRDDRENAGRSNGPRTEAGNDRLRFHALEQGLRVVSPEPRLSHEDAEAMEEAVRRWTEQFQPANSLEKDLIGRAARLSVLLKRVEQHEAALVARRIRKALLGSRTKRGKKVGELTGKLFSMVGGVSPYEEGSTANDDPMVVMAKLEMYSEGARWLLDRWTEIRSLTRSEEGWTAVDQFRFIRLLGKYPIHAVDDPELNAMLLAWETIEEGLGKGFFAAIQEQVPRDGSIFSAERPWREIVGRPESAEAASAFLEGLAEREIARLEELAGVLEEIEEADAAELADRASFLNTDEGERLRRYVTARTRELHRILEHLIKLRKAGRELRAWNASE